MASNSSISKGLDVIFGASKLDISDSLEYIKIQNITPNRFQPRKVFNEEELEGLKNSIIQNGIIQPVILRKIDEVNFEIVAGERRCKAAFLAGLEQVPAIIKNIDDSVAATFAIIENIQRQDLNCIEEALSIQRLIDEFKLPISEISAKLGKPRSTVANQLRLLSLASELQKMLIDGKLSVGHAKLLLALPENTQQIIAYEIVDNNMSVRDLEAYISKINTKTKNIRKKNIAHQYTKKWHDELSKQFKQVDIKINAEGKGRVIIHMNAIEEIDAFINLISRS